MKVNVKQLISKIIFAIINCVSVGLCLSQLQSLHPAIKIGLIVIFSTCFLLMLFLESGLIYKFTALISIVGIIFVGAYAVCEYLGWIEYLKDFDAIKSFILNTQQWGIIIYLLITIFQVIFLPIPSAIIILIGVVIYGPFWAFVLSLVGTYAGSIICFWLGKSFGRKLIDWLVGKETATKYADLIGRRGKLIFVLMLLFPFFPDDTLCLVAGVTSMSWKFFLISTIATRPIMVAFTSFFGSGEIIPYSGWGIPVWIALFVLCLVLMFLANKFKDRIFSKHKKLLNKHAK